VPEIISAFGLSRFTEGALVGEKGAAAVGHQFAWHPPCHGGDFSLYVERGRG
jgi:hypothetical protein